MRLSTPLRPSLGKFALFVFLLTILQLSFSSLVSAQPYVQPQVGSPSTVNPCGVVGFQLHNLPPDVTLSKIMWYGNGAYVGTTLQVTDVQNVIMNANDGDGKYNVYAVAYYSTGATNQTANYQVQLAGVGLNTITQGAPAYLNCPTAVTFSTSWVSQLYVPQSPSDITSYTWSFPSSGWTVTSSGSGSANTAPTVTVIPDGSSAGNVMVTTKLSCGYAFTSPALAIPRPTEAPTFGSVSPFPVCNNTTPTATIDPVCGATSYIWTISGNTQATFQANGTQSLTTPATSAMISAGTVGTSGFSMSVQSVYPNGETSNATTTNISTGTLVPSAISPASGTVAPNSTQAFFAIGADSWSVGNGTILTGQGTDAITVKVANISNGQLGVVASGSDACGIGRVVASYTISSSGGGGGCIICTTTNNPTADSVALSDSTFTTLSSVRSSSLYPNPSTNSFQVIIPQTDFTKTYVNIYDINGHLVRAIIPNGQTTLVDASHWAKGTYIASIFDGKKLTTQKLIKL